MLLILRMMVLALAVAAAGPALGHAMLVEASPADGATLARSPSAVVLRFNEPVTPVALRLLDPGGRVVDELPAGSSTGSEIALRVAAPLASGSYVVSYRVISADAHPVGGSLVFGVGMAAQRPAAMPAHEPWRLPYIVVRLLLYATLLPVAGGVMFLALIDVPPVARAIIRRGLSLGAAAAGLAAAINLAVKAAQLAAISIADPTAWLLAGGSSFGLSIAVALTGLVAVAIGLRGWPRRSARWLACAGAVAAAGSFALTGHSATVSPRWLGALLMLGHGLAIAFWAGALWPLIMVLHRAPDAAPAIVARFSRLAVITVALLIVCGTGMAALELETPQALASSEYGRDLLLKLVFVVPLLALAAVNKWQLLPELGTRSVAPRLWFVRSVRGEAGVMLAILAMTAVLSSTSPPRTVAGAHGGPVYAVSAGRQAAIELTPGIAGPNALAVRLTQDGQPLNPLEVLCELALPDAGIEPIRRPLVADGDGHYRWDGIVPVSGTWRLRVEALITDFEKADFTADITVR